MSTVSVGKKEVGWGVGKEKMKMRGSMWEVDWFSFSLLVNVISGHRHSEDAGFVFLYRH